MKTLINIPNSQAGSRYCDFSAKIWVRKLCSLVDLVEKLLAEARLSCDYDEKDICSLARYTTEKVDWSLFRGYVLLPEGNETRQHKTWVLLTAVYFSMAWTIYAGKKNRSSCHHYLILTWGWSTFSWNFKLFSKYRKIVGFESVWDTRMLNTIAMMADFKMLYGMQAISMLYVTFAYNSAIWQLPMPSKAISIVCVHDVWDFDSKLTPRRNCHAPYKGQLRFQVC